MTKILLSPQQPKDVIIDRAAKRKFLEATAKRVCPEENKKFRARVRDTVTAHYRNTVIEVRKVLHRQNTPPARSALGKYDERPARKYSISLRGVGRRHRLVTAPWRALSKDYAERKKVSTHFWYKQGNLYPAFKHAGLKNGKVHQLKTSDGRGHAGMKKVGQSAKGKDQYVCHSVNKIELQRLPYPLGKMLSDSFLFAAPVRNQGMPTSRVGLNVAYYPEHFRPFIADAAAILGRAMYDKLRKLK